MLSYQHQFGFVILIPTTAFPWESLFVGGSLIHQVPGHEILFGVAPQCIQSVKCGGQREKFGGLHKYLVMSRNASAEMSPGQCLQVCGKPRPTAKL